MSALPAARDQQLPTQERQLKRLAPVALSPLDGLLAGSVVGKSALSELVSLPGLPRLQQLRSENLPQLLDDMLPRAMAGDQEIRRAVGNEAQRVLNSISRRIEQMQTADNRVYTFYSRYCAHVVDGVDQPAVAASGQDKQPSAGLEPDRQFVADEVGMILFCIEEKRSASVLKGRPSRDGAADSDRWRQVTRCLDLGAAVRRQLTQGEINGVADADGAWGLVWMATESLGAESSAEQYSCAGVGRQKVGNAAGVVIVPVAEHQCARQAQVNSQAPGVVVERRSLPRIEQDALLTRLDPGSKAVFGGQLGRAIVIDQQGDSYHLIVHRLARFSNVKVV